MAPHEDTPGARLVEAPVTGWRQLHAIALRALERLAEEFDAELVEAFDDDPALAEMSLTRPSLTLTPREPESAPLAIAFTDTGLYVRFGQWYTRSFPAIESESVENFVEERDRFAWRVVQLVEGRFRESSVGVQPGLVIQQHEFWSADGARAGGECKVRTDASAPVERETTLRWQPWSPRRKSTSSR